MQLLFGLFVLAGTLLITACSETVERAPAIGEAYTGPVTLNIRKEISLKSPVVGSARHGDKLDVLQQRRRFLRVRAPGGAEGWVDAEKLMTPEQMGDLRHISEAAAKLPSQGEATVFEVLNLHTEPNRGAPSFLQLKEGDKIEVVGHKLASRAPFPSAVSRMLNPPVPSPEARRSRNRDKKAKERDASLPPMPAPPPLPSNWIELSPRQPVEEKPPPPEKKDVRLRPEPPKFEDWSLVRTPEGKAGWVLTRMVLMSIPEDVSRYAEGHRITSWFPLGEVKSAEGVKKHYLWTTIVRGGQPYEFDGFRIFIYNARRERYETAYREKEVEGYFPTIVHPVQTQVAKKTVTLPGFSLIVKEDDAFLRKTYVFEVNRVRLVNQEPWQPSPDSLEVRASDAGKPEEPTKEPPGLMERLKKYLPWKAS